MGYARRMQLPDERPKIEYPADWTYQVIGAHEERLRQAVREVAGGRPHVLELSKTSRTGKYVSLKVEVRVRDERERLDVFEALAAHSEVRIVL